jgi:hypothetical protein
MKHLVAALPIAIALLLPTTVAFAEGSAKEPAAAHAKSAKVKKPKGKHAKPAASKTKKPHVKKAAAKKP